MDIPTGAWERAKEIFSRAAELEPARRGVYLDEICEDLRLRRCVEALLNVDSETSRWLRGSVERAARAVAEEPWAGRLLGPFRLLEQLGAGGMGTVFLAERADGEFQQRVAVKVVGRGPLLWEPLPRELRRRFLFERQILARLQHPHIARLLDGGTTDEGVPYLVMEHIEGEPLTVYCRRRGLTTPERLHLVRQVCAAVDYAHHNLVVHRDLKPDNILVTASGEVKLLDFGIAKLLESGAEGFGIDEPPETRGDSPILTPRYASPEQLLGDPITTASDVYSLGVVLYELLSGRPPFEAPAGPKSLDHLAPEAQAPPPLQVARGRSGGRRTDLDRVVLKAIARPPEERYATAGELAQDLVRFLNHEPVRAAPPGALYRLRKLLRRRRASVSLAALLTLSLLGGFVARGQEARRANRAAEAARVAQSNAVQVSHFLAGLFKVSEPGANRGGEITAREILEIGDERMRRELVGQPRIRAHLTRAIGEVYQNLGMYPDAVARFEEALRIHRRVDGPVHASVADDLENLGFAYLGAGRAKEAERALRGALAVRERDAEAEPARLANTLDELGTFYRQQGRFRQARALLERALELRRRDPETAPLRLAATLNHLGLLNTEQYRDPEGLRLLDEARRLREEALGPAHPLIALSLNSQAVAAAQLGRLEDARDLFQRSLELRRKSQGADHPDVGQSLFNLACLHLDLGEPEAALPLLERAEGIWKAAHGPDHPRIGGVMVVRGQVWDTLGNAAAAEADFDRAIEILEAGLGPRSLRLAEPLGELARLRAAAGHGDEAERLFRRALAIREEALEADHPDLASLREAFADFLQRSGR